MDKGQWIRYSWIKNQNFDYKIHPDDLELANEIGGLGEVLLIGESDEWLTIIYKHYKLRVLRPEKGIIKVSRPCFIWDEYVHYKDKIYQIGDIGWHYKDEYYFYYLKRWRKVSKRLKCEDLRSAYPIPCRNCDKVNGEI